MSYHRNDDEPTHIVVESYRDYSARKELDARIHNEQARKNNTILLIAGFIGTIIIVGMYYIKTIT